MLYESLRRWPGWRSTAGCKYEILVPGDPGSHGTFMIFRQFFEKNRNYNLQHCPDRFRAEGCEALSLSRKWWFQNNFFVIQVSSYYSKWNLYVSFLRCLQINLMCEQLSEHQPCYQRCGRTIKMIYRKDIVNFHDFLLCFGLSRSKLMTRPAAHQISQFL